MVLHLIACKFGVEIVVERAVSYGILVSFLIGLTSCREYFPTSPSPAPETSISVIDLDGLYFAVENEPLAIGFDVKATDEDGFPISGIPLDIRVMTDNGSIATPQFITNGQGLVHALYYNPQPINDCTVKLQIVVNSDTLTSEFNLNVRPSPAAIKAKYKVQTIYAKPNKKIEKSVSFKVTNTEGKPVPYADVAFRIVSGNAAIESVAYADQNGLVRAFLTFTPTENCQVVVQAEVRFVELESDDKRGGALRLNISKNLPHINQSPVRQLLKAETTIKVILE